MNKNKKPLLIGAAFLLAILSKNLPLFYQIPKKDTYFLRIHETFGFL